MWSFPREGRIWELKLNQNTPDIFASCEHR